jgi:GT2 family glycosyltransferase
MTETPGSFQSKKAGSSYGAPLSVILVNYNDLAHIEASLLSLQAADLPPATEIIVVDNDSSDGSRELVASRFPRVRLVTNRENVGFPRANNQGAQESHGEFLLFLNTDTIVPPGALAPLLDLMRADGSVGAAGPRPFH